MLTCEKHSTTKDGYQTTVLAHLLLTFLVYEELEVLERMVTDEDLCCWFADQKLLHITSVTTFVLIIFHPIHLVMSNKNHIV